MFHTIRLIFDIKILDFLKSSHSSSPLSSLFIVKHLKRMIQSILAGTTGVIIINQYTFISSTCSALIFVDWLYQQQATFKAIIYVIILSFSSRSMLKFPSLGAACSLFSSSSTSSISSCFSTVRVCLPQRLRCEGHWLTAPSSNSWWVFTNNTNF